MNFTSKLTRLAVILVFAGSIPFGVGCLNAADSLPGSGNNLTVAQAREQLQNILDKAFYKKEIQATDDGFQIYYPHDLFGAPVWWDGKTFNYRFKDLAGSKVVGQGLAFGRHYQVKGVNVYWRQKESAQAFADALDVLARNSNEPVQTPVAEPATPVPAAPTTVNHAAPDESFRSAPPEAGSRTHSDMAADQTSLSSREPAAPLLAASDPSPFKSVSSVDTPPPVSSTAPPATAPEQTPPGTPDTVGNVSINAAVPAQSAGTNAADTLKQYVTDWQNIPNTLEKFPARYDLLTKIVILAAAMNPKPEIPEEAREHFIKAATLLKAANEPSDYDLVVKEYLAAQNLAPWWPDLYYNLASVAEARKHYDSAIRDLKLYLASNPDDARAAQDKIYQIQAEKDLAAKHAADEQAKAQEEARAKEEAQRQAFIGKWCLVNNDNACLTIASFASVTVNWGLDFGLNSSPMFPIYTSQSYSINNIQILGKTISFTTTGDGIVHYPTTDGDGGGSYTFHFSHDYMLTMSDDGKSLIGKCHGIFTLGSPLADVPSSVRRRVLKNGSGPPQDMTWDYKFIRRDF